MFQTSTYRCICMSICMCVCLGTCLHCCMYSTCHAHTTHTCTHTQHTQHTIMGILHNCSPTKSLSKLRRNIRFTQTHQHLRVRSAILLLCLVLFFVLLCMCACMYPCVFSIAKLTGSSRLHRYPSQKPSISAPVQKQYVIQGMGECSFGGRGCIGFGC